MRKILITGITGFLGSSIAVELLKRNYEIVGIIRKHSSFDRIKKIENKIILVESEANNYQKLFDDNKQIDIVIHTATCYGRNNETPLEIFDSNTRFPLELLDISSKSNVKVFINTDTVLDKFLNIYSLSKNHLLEWGKFYSSNFEIKFINLKLEHFYGRGDDNNKFIASLIELCKNNEQKIDLTLGNQKRDFIHISDVVEAYILILNDALKNTIWFDEYEIGSGKSVSIKQFAKTVHLLTKSSSELNFGAIPYRKNEVMESKANIERLIKMGWSCRLNIEEGLKITIK